MSTDSEEGLSIKDVNFVHGCVVGLVLFRWCRHPDVSGKAKVSLFLQTPRYHKGTITVDSDSLVWVLLCSLHILKQGTEPPMWIGRLSLLNIYLFYFGCIGSSLLLGDFSLVVASRVTLQFPCTGFSLWWILLLQGTGFRAQVLQRLQPPGSRAQA